MPWVRLPLYLFAEDYHRYVFLPCELEDIPIVPPSSLDPWAAAHYAIGNYNLCSREHHLWGCVEYEHAYCWKRFVLCFPGSEVFDPVAVQ
jgi:hypothetical protein